MAARSSRKSALRSRRRRARRCSLRWPLRLLLTPSGMVLRRGRRLETRLAKAAMSATNSRRPAHIMSMAITCRLGLMVEAGCPTQMPVLVT